MYLLSPTICLLILQGSSTKIGEFDLQDEDDNYRHHMQVSLEVKQAISTDLEFQQNAVNPPLSFLPSGQMILLCTGGVPYY